ncbi:hypothetical protein GGX14DRAFT_395232 [Mycena pura]|uniref:Uncharacterized protein n=1 Tax=Mycena pura TaxID=153505 RepID=A0AAD6VCM7_9AGAR|nr:hypothetical protein GGX14DRAFT_395232 [Mycena pura]
MSGNPLLCATEEGSVNIPSAKLIIAHVIKIYNAETESPFGQTPFNLEYEKFAARVNGIRDEIMCSRAQRPATGTRSPMMMLLHHAAEPDTMIVWPQTVPLPFDIQSTPPFHGISPLNWFYAHCCGPDRAFRHSMVAVVLEDPRSKVLTSMRHLGWDAVKRGQLGKLCMVQNGAWVEIYSYGPIHAFSTSAGIFIQGWHSCPEWPTRLIVPRGVSTRASVVFTAASLAYGSNRGTLNQSGETLRGHAKLCAALAQYGAAPSPRRSQLIPGLDTFTGRGPRGNAADKFYIGCVACDKFYIKNAHSILGTCIPFHWLHCQR